MPVTQALRKLKQDSGEFETSLDYTVKLSFNNRVGRRGEGELFPLKGIPQVPCRVEIHFSLYSPLYH